MQAWGDCGLRCRFSVGINDQPRHDQPFLAELGARFASDDEGHRAYLKEKSSLVEELLARAYTGAGLVRDP